MAPRFRLARRLGQAELNTVGYVVSRYGRLTGRDLELLSHNQDPWRNADVRRRALGESSVRITHEELATFFLAEASLDDEGDEFVILTDQQMADAIAEARARSGPAAGRVDDQDRLRDRLASLVAESGAT